MRPGTARGFTAAMIAIVLAGCASSSAPPLRGGSTAATGVFDVGLAGQAAAFEARWMTDGREP